MKITTTLMWVWMSVVSTCAAEQWSFHCEAEKGDQTASIPRQASTLDTYLLSLPKFSSDPLDATTTIQNSSTRQVGTIGGRRIVEVQLQIKESYYTDVYLLLCETESGHYLPVYAQQYRSDVKKPSLAEVVSKDGESTLTVVVNYSGSDPATTTDVVTLKSEGAKGLELKTLRKG